MTAATGITGGSRSSIAALFLDADHDGDLDLWVGQDTAPGGSRLFNNNADGTFTDLALTNGLAQATAPTVGVLYGDLDGDRDFDLVLLARGAPVRIFLNDLLGQYTELNLAGLELRGDLGGVLQDFNGDGTLDLALLGGEPAALRFYAGDGRGRFQPGDGFAGVSAALDSWGPLRAVRAADVDLDGDLDLAVFGREGHLLLNDGRGRFVLQPQVWRFGGDWTLAGVELLDLTGDLVPDLLCLEQGAGSRIALVPGELTPPGTALALAPTGVRGRDKRTRSPASGFGVTITLRSAWREQVRTFTGVNGGANQSVVPVVLGLGGMARADYAQLLWPDGVAQVEVALTAAQVHRVAEIQRKISSCPVLFAWNGQRFEFVTDFAGVGGLGYFVAPGECAPPQVLEHVKIEPHQLRPRDGMFELRVTEPMEEAAYMDRLELWAIDHPASVVVYPDERLAVSGPPPRTSGWPSPTAPFRCGQ
ncbi:MAG: CRTAC1 family protein [Verrucomicrobia bacterium]|nr:CRTAC1 family protein [Verrucomicrobiota bacterium]